MRFCTYAEVKYSTSISVAMECTFQITIIVLPSGVLRPDINVLAKASANVNLICVTNWRSVAKLENNANVHIYMFFRYIYIPFKHLKLELKGHAFDLCKLL